MVAIQPNKQVLLNSVTSTTTSSGFPVNNAGRLSLQFIAAGITSGIGTFTVDVTNDGLNWATYNRLVPNLTGTNSQTDAYVTNKVLNSSGSSMVFFPPGDTFSSVRATVTCVTDGTYSVVAYIN